MSKQFYRKITQSKWSEQINGNISPVQADAISVDLKTTQNTLSLWSTSTHADAVLALCSGLDKVEKLQLILITSAYHENMISDSLEFKQTPGKTKVEDLKDKHFDIVNMTTSELIKVSKTFADIIVKDKVIKLTRTDVGKILLEALKNGRLKYDELSEYLKADLKKVEESFK